MTNTVERTPFPAPLAAHFDEGELAREKATIAAIDPHGAILWVNPAWHAFAAANGGAEIAERFGPGASYLEGIGPPLRGAYAATFANALLTGEPYAQEYECSSPDVLRVFRLRALPVDGAVLLLEHTLVVEQPMDRLTAEPIERRYRRRDGVVVQCSNCRRVQRADRSAWDWLPSWAARSPEMTSHGLCATCAAFYWSVRGGL